MTEVGALLKGIEDSARERHIPVILGDGARILARETERIRPSRILEIGTAIGYSGILMLSHSPSDCLLDTIEKDEARADEAERNFTAAGCRDRVMLYRGDSSDILPRFKERRYDLIFMDGAKSNYKKDVLYLETLLTEKGIIFTDNVLFHGMVDRQGKIPHKHRTMVRNLREYVGILREQEDFETELLELGDGITITRKKL